MDNGRGFEKRMMRKQVMKKRITKRTMKTSEKEVVVTAAPCIEILEEVLYNLDPNN